MKEKSEEKSEKVDKTNSIDLGHNQKEKFYVRVTGSKLYKRKILIRILLIIVASLLLFLSVVYAALYLVSEVGNFTVSLDPNLKANQHIEVSQYKDFSTKSLTLRADALDYMDNISELWLPEDIDADYDGPHNGQEFIAYTFYVRNSGEEKAEYQAIINVLSVINNVDEAVRVGVYYNGEKTVYAKKQKDSEEPEPGTVAFKNYNTVMKKNVFEIQPGQIDKYTIVIWLEGDDPQCTNDIQGGEMKLKMFIHEITDNTNFDPIIEEALNPQDGQENNEEQQSDEQQE